MMPSRWEGFGVAAVEAEAMGVPVLGTKVGGIPEVVKDGVSGTLVPREDYEALGHQLQKLIENPKLITKLSQGAAKYARQHFDWDKNTESMFSIYRRLVKDGE
jgi:glycosyltransferase involved in cell wall biosynthesis